jgi:hypothetical protein
MKVTALKKMTDAERMAILEEETFILRDSGEIPEIAFHSTLHYLTEDEEGPEMVLSGDELKLLQDAALFRYREIVLRDLDPANRDLSIYRGVCRTIYNWQRMQDFCKRIGRDASSFKNTAGQALVDFLIQELTDVKNGSRISSTNCSVQQLLDLAAMLDISADSLPDGWQNLCPE